MTAHVDATAAGLGLAIDAIVGEPPARWHPVVAFGRLMSAVEGRLHAPRRINGVAHVAIGVGAGLAFGHALRLILGRGPATAVAVALCSAGRMLDEEARAVRDHLDRGDLAMARAHLRSLAGRDASALDDGEIARAVIESVAENCVDAVTATVWWATLAGAPGACAHRAVNTLDAMVGHRDARYGDFGWAAARLDDLANFVPARLTALAVAAVRPHRARAVLRTVRHDAHRHPSPNGGVIEAAFAAALGIRLGGVNRYGEVSEDRGTLGVGRSPSASDVEAAIRLRRHATVAVVALLCLVASRRCDGGSARPSR